MMFNKQFKFEIDLETGEILDNNLLECFGGGKGASAPTPVYTPPPAAPEATEAATQEAAVTPEEEAAKQKEALKKGAKSLQIPVTTGATDTGTVGTQTSTSTNA